MMAIIPMALKIKYLTMVTLLLLVNFKVIATETPIPVFNNAYKIEKHENEEKTITSVSYKVNLPYCSKKVYHFYTKQLEARGWKPYADPGYEGSICRWQEFIDATKKNKPIIKQLIAYWINKEKNKRAVLGIRYIIQDNSAKLQDKLMPQKIVFQIMPFKELPSPKIRNLLRTPKTD